MRCVSVILVAYLEQVASVRPWMTDPTTEFKIIALSDIHGTQKQNLNPGDIGTIPLGFDDLPADLKSSSDSINFLEGPVWNYITDAVASKYVKGILYGGDATTGFNPFLRPDKKKEDDETPVFRNDICQQSGVDDITNLVKNFSSLGIPVWMLAGNHDSCLDTEIIKARKADDITTNKILEKSENLIRWINSHTNVKLLNKMEEVVELSPFSSARALCVSSSSPARAGAKKTRGSGEVWGADLIGAFQYVQDGNSNSQAPDGDRNRFDTFKARPCPRWANSKCSVIAYHGVPGCPHTPFPNPELKCHKEMVEAINEAINHGLEPVLLGGHFHGKTFRPEKEPTSRNFGVAWYEYNASNKVLFGNTAVKWNEPFDKEKTKEYVDRREGFGWINPLVITCRENGDGCILCRDGPNSDDCLTKSFDEIKN